MKYDCNAKAKRGRGTCSSFSFKVKTQVRACVRAPRVWFRRFSATWRYLVSGGTSLLRVIISGAGARCFDNTRSLPMLWWDRVFYLSDDKRGHKTTSSCAHIDLL